MKIKLSLLVSAQTLMGCVVSGLLAGPVQTRAEGAAAAESRPNIVFVLIDDLAMGDVGCFGQKKIKTPNMDRMAREGTRYTQFYSGSSVCAPSRASLMTGLTVGHCPIRANCELPGEGQMPLPTELPTVGEILKSAGYATACTGKWGMGMFETTGSPLKKGFDHFFGYNCQRHAHQYFPSYLYNDDKKVTLDGKQYAPDIIAEDTFKWIRTHADKPFFLYYPTNLTHNLGIDTLGEYAKEKWSHPDKVHAAMTTRVDAHIGKLLDLLQELKIDDKTIVFVAAGDNGPDTDPQGDRCKLFGTATDLNLRGFKRSMYEGGIRQGGIVRWPGKVPAGRTVDEPWAFWDFLPTAADLAGAALPTNGKIDGISIRSELLGGEMPKRPYFYWELNEPHFKQAIRFNDWKALRDGPSVPLELYDLKNDPSESKNLAAAHPELVAQAEALMKQARTDDPNWPVTGANYKKKHPNHADPSAR